MENDNWKEYLNAVFGDKVRESDLEKTTAVIWARLLEELQIELRMQSLIWKINLISFLQTIIKIVCTVANVGLTERFLML